MMITAYQVNNVLRVYGDQLRHGRISSRPKDMDAGLPDRISISTKARRKTIIDNITDNIVGKITQYGPYDKVEKEVFNPNGLIFKEIDENGETINSLSIEDSNFLTNKLKEITEETIDKNMK
jgi:hypothetical protein